MPKVSPQRKLWVRILTRIRAPVARHSSAMPVEIRGFDSERIGLSNVRVAPNACAAPTALCFLISANPQLALWADLLHSALWALGHGV